MLNEKLVTEYFEVLDGLKELAKRKKDLEAELALEGSGEKIVGDYEVKWSTTKTFNQQVALGKLTKKELELVQKVTVDGAKMKALYPKKYENSRVESANPTVKVELVSE